MVFDTLSYSAGPLPEQLLQATHASPAPRPHLARTSPASRTRFSGRSAGDDSRVDCVWHRGPVDARQTCRVARQIRAGARFNLEPDLNRISACIRYESRPNLATPVQVRGVEGLPGVGHCPHDEAPAQVGCRPAGAHECNTSDTRSYPACCRHEFRVHPSQDRTREVAASRCAGQSSYHRLRRGAHQRVGSLI